VTEDAAWEVAPTTAHPTAIELAEALARDAGSRVEITRRDSDAWVGIDETSNGTTFAEANAESMRIVPLIGDPQLLGSRPFVRSIVPSWVDGHDEIVIDLDGLQGYADRGQVMDLMHAALNHWVKAGESAATARATGTIR